MDAAYILEEADRLGHGLRERMVHLRADSGDLAPDLTGNIARHEVVDLVDTRERPERLGGEMDIGMDEELLREFDDGTIGTAYVLARPALSAQARDDLNNEINLIGQQWIEIDEGGGRELRERNIGREPCMVRQAAAVLREEVTEALFGGGILGEHALAGHLGDIRRLQVDLEGEAIHQPGKLDPLVIQAANKLGELFLRGHH